MADIAGAWNFSLSLILIRSEMCDRGQTWKIKKENDNYDESYHDGFDKKNELRHLVRRAELDV